MNHSLPSQLPRMMTLFDDHWFEGRRTLGGKICTKLSPSAALQAWRRCIECRADKLPSAIRATWFPKWSWKQNFLQLLSVIPSGSTLRSVTVKLEGSTYSGRPINNPIPHSRHVFPQIQNRHQSGCTRTALKGRRHSRSWWSAASATPRLLNFPSYQRNFFTFTIAGCDLCDRDNLFGKTKRGSSEKSEL